MRNITRPPSLTASKEMVTRLISAGYLKPALRNDAGAVADAIGQMKHDLRNGAKSRLAQVGEDIVAAPQKAVPVSR